MVGIVKGWVGEQGGRASIRILWKAVGWGKMMGGL